MISQGYTPGAPSQQAEEIDAAVAERHPCSKCGGKMYYDAYHTQTSYIAFAVCRACGCRVEF
jgi:hypothetical protein